VLTAHFAVMLLAITACTGASDAEPGAGDAAGQGGSLQPQPPPPSPPSPPSLAPEASDGSPPTGGGTFAGLYQRVIETRSCLACHTSGHYPGTTLRMARDADGGLQAAYAALIAGAASAQGPCAGETLVVPGAACERSVLYQKLTLEPGCGLPMPVERTAPVPAGDLDALCTWIEAGAPF
jgi:hypothetical protein